MQRSKREETDWKSRLSGPANANPSEDKESAIRENGEEERYNDNATAEEIISILMKQPLDSGSVGRTKQAILLC